MPIERRRLYYSGRVQGVGFRLTARRIALRFGVAGYARNLPDGRVEVLAEAEDQRLKCFLDELQREMQAGIRSTDSETLSSDPPLAPDFEVRG